jgi:hypothetical protein
MTRNRQRQADFVGYIKKGLRPPIPLTRQRHSPHRSNLAQIVLAVSPNRSDGCDDRKPGQEKTMSEQTIDSDNTSKPALDTAKPKGARKPTKKAKPAKKANRAKKAAAKPKADRTNKKAEVIAMMKRTKGATLGEIRRATGWQPHTVRGFVSILGSKGGEKFESSKNAARERTYKIGK